MTKMLASVTGVDEAEIAIAGGADIIDLKDPTAGALGAVPTDSIRQDVAAVAGRRATSAVCGDLPMQPEAIGAKAEEIAATGVDYVKVGFFPSREAAACAAALAPVAARTKLIAVLFADLEPDFDLLPVFAEHGFHGVMVDTADKAKGPAARPPAAGTNSGFRRTRQVARPCGGAERLAGRTRHSAAAALRTRFPGLSGCAVLRSRRSGPIDAQAVARIRALIPEERGTGRSAERRLSAARGARLFSGCRGATLGTDRIFVRDFVLPVEIGAYSFEHGHTQKVRFDVGADVLRMTENPEDMRHVFSYDIIMDGIRAIVGRGHVELSETLAGQIAARVLEDPRVMRVTVRVEKLELGAGGVGVEIERKRSRPRATAARPDASPDRGETAGRGRQGPRP